MFIDLLGIQIYLHNISLSRSIKNKVIKINLKTVIHNSMILNQF